MRVENRLPTGIVSTGSGVAVHQEGDKVLVLTASHIFDQRGEARVTFPNGTKGQGRCFGRSMYEDLAGLEITVAGKVPTVPIADDTIGAGDSLWMVGYPGGVDRPIPREGRVVDVEGRILHHDVRGQQGDSGGGLFDVRTGHLVAITTHGDPVDQYGRLVRKGYKKSTGLQEIQRWTATENCCKLFPGLRAQMESRQKARSDARKKAASPPPGPVVGGHKPPGVTPTPGPVAPAPDNSAVLAKLDAMQRQITELQNRPIQKGDQGDKGDKGDATKGDKGDDGKGADPAALAAIQADVAALRNEMKALSAKVTVTVFEPKK